MRDRDLTGPWAGFSFRRGELITPEGKHFGPKELGWLGLTVQLAREWKFMMDDASPPHAKISSAVPKRSTSPKVIYLRDEIHRRAQEAKGRRQEDVSQVRRSYDGGPENTKA